MADDYILTFQGVKDAEDNELQLSIFFDTSTQISTSSKNVDIDLNSINIDKEMYKPCCITAEVDLVYTGTLNESDISQIVSKLLNKTVNIGTSTESTHNIAKGYRVVNIQPRRKWDDKSLKTTLTISMYSPDKYLDMKKYSKCYTAKRLGKDILEGLNTELDKDHKITLDYTHQQNMLYEVKDTDFDKESNILKDAYVIETETTDKDGNKLTKKYLEGIHPYLVQYNETPYHFLARSANKCGEFLFYEDGKLWLGLDTSKSDAMKSTIEKTTDGLDIKVFDTSPKGATKIAEGDIADVIYNEYQEEDQCDMQSWDYTLEEKKEEEKKDKPKHKKHIGSGDKVQTYEGPSEEYLNGYDDNKEDKYKFAWVKKWPSNIYSILQADDAVDIIAKAGAIETSEAFVWGTIKKPKNEKDYKDDFVDKYTDKNKIDYVHYDKGESKIHQFSLAKKYNASLTHDLYQQCRKCSEVVQKRTIFVKLRNDSNIILKLGDLVNIFNREYVVTKLHYEAKLSDSETNNWFEAVPVLAVVSQKTEKTVKKKVQNSETGKEEDKDVTETEKSYKPCYTPALLADNQKRTAAPQRAYVISTKDPLSLGRIRILYPWQPNDDKDKNKNDEYSSPFIRVAQPFASKDGGIRFTPQEGDEVMIGYEFDDIERPFVIGAVSSMDTNGPKNSGVICSTNGHKIQFSDPKDSYGFCTGFSPVLGTLSKWNIKPLDFDNLKNSKELAGGIQLTDTFGVYNLDLSTDKRKITIQSPLGSIQMDAFTGITINCPNGDIALKGKNITIEAGDKLSLASGKNIDKQKMYYDKKVYTRKSVGVGTGNLIFNTALDTFGGAEDFLKLNLADMKTLRAVMDALLKPINGTMSIRSGRFMQIEAGKGKTKLPNFYEAGSIMFKHYEKQENNLWMRYLVKLNDWYDDMVSSDKAIESVTAEIPTLIADAVPDGYLIQIGEASKTKADYQTEIQRLYINVSKTNQKEINEYIRDTVAPKLGSVKIARDGERPYEGLSDYQKESITEKIQNLLENKLKHQKLEDGVETLMANHTENDKINVYANNIKTYYTESKTLNNTNAEQKKRKFFFDVIKKTLLKDGHLKIYYYKSFNKIKIPDMSIDTKSDDVWKEPGNWKKFIGVIYPPKDWSNNLYAEYSGWGNFCQEFLSTTGLWKPNIGGGAILMADSNTDGHTVSFDMGNSVILDNLELDKLKDVNVSFKAVADGGTTAAKDILSGL